VGNCELLSKCHVNTNIDLDTFVGIRVIDGDIKICFPLGYRLAENDELVRKDILNLITVLKHFEYKIDKILPNQIDKSNELVQLSVLPLLKIIQDYLHNGYYYEKETKYKVAKTGKVNWSKTIKTQKSHLQGVDVYYLNFVVKDKTVNSDQLITQIHEYCVFESFSKLGWLYTKSLPKKPKIKYEKKLFLSVLYEKMGQTFNDRNREQLQNMIDLINSMGNKGFPNRFFYGTNKFEYVWEKMIDYVFGVDSKNKFFPRTKWHLLSGKTRENNAIEPDTVMVNGNKIFVLDAKYYKYGSTAIPSHLPESTSINKQIIYGEYIAKNEGFKKEFGDDIEVYNAFLMPFSRDSKYFATKENYKYVGEGTGDWKQSGEPFEHVQGVLLDVKYIMYNLNRYDINEISNLSDKIVNGFRFKRD
jgi:hypothetical protein